MRGFRVPAGLDPLFWRVLGGVLVSSVGIGLTLPFLLVYLHTVRGFSTLVASLVIAWVGLASLAVTPASGSLTDRWGPMPVLIGGLLVAGAGSVGLAFTTTVPVALVTTATAAAGWTVSATAESTLISRLARDAAQEWVFGFQYVVFSAGIGLGALIAGLVVDTSEPGTFQAIYLGDAASYVLYALLMLTMSGAGKAPGPDVDETVAPPGSPTGMRAVWADPLMRRLIVIFTIVLLCGAGQVESGFPAYATQVAQVSPQVLAAAYVANTLTIVLGQLVVLPNIVGRSRSRLIAAGCAAWAACWLLLSAAGRSAGTTVAAALVVGAFVVFSFGEILASPVAPSLVNDLAPEALRGRYNAALSLTFTMGTLAGPVLAGLTIGTGLPSLWVALVAGGNLLGGWLMLRTRPLLTAAQDGRVLPPLATEA